MSIKTEEHAKESEPLPMKYILRLLFWVIFSIISIVVTVKFFEIYVNNNGLNSFFYLLIFLLSLGLIFIIYPKLNRMFQQDQTGDMEKYLKNNKNNIVIGYLVKDDKEDDFLDLDYILTRKNIKINRKSEKKDKKIWLEDEKKLFQV